MRVSKRIVLGLTGTLLSTSSVRAVLGPWQETAEAKVRLLSRFASVPAGGDAGLALEFELVPGWHVYWKNPGDAGYPPALIFAGDTLVAPRLLYPAPTRFELPGDLVAFGYADRVTHPLEGRLAAGAPNPADLAATIDFLVCRESCVPRKLSLALRLPMGLAAVDPEAAPLVDSVRARLPAKAPAGVTGRLVAGDGEEMTLELNFTVPGARALAQGVPQLFFETHPLLDLRRPEPIESSSGSGFCVPLRPFDETKPLPDRLHFSWTATGFEQDGAPTAWEGELDLERPRAGRGSALARGVPIALVAFVIFLFLTRRATRASSRSTPA